MNMKKIMGAVGALVCAINFFTATPVWAVPSAEKQEAAAHESFKKKFKGIISTSENAKILSPVLNEIEKRICDANGLIITDQRFQYDHDFKTKLHPVQIVDYTDNAHAAGAGHIYIGAKHIEKAYGAQNFRNQYDYMCVEKLLSHEITHNIEGHRFRRSSEADNELDAEKGVVRLTDSLPEGGWGVYLVAVNRRLNRAEQNYQILASFGKEANGKIKVTGSDTEHVFYKTSNGKEYPLVIGESISTRLRNANAYFGGQVAYCIAKGAFRPENIQIAPNNLRDIKFEGDYLLVCRSPKLPNGYRVLAGVFGDYEALVYNLNVAKEQVGNDYPLSVGYKNLKQAIHEFKIQSIEEAYWISWLACAVAQDNANR